MMKINQFFGIMRFALFGPIREAFGSFMAISRKIFTRGSRLLCFTQNDHTGQTEFIICPFFKWAQYFIFNLIFPLHLFSSYVSF